MSYTRRYEEKISIPYSGYADATGNCSCGKSVSCRGPFNGVAEETIYTTIMVDTTPFDDSVANCNTNVNVLTGAVVATEAAQIMSIDANAKKVGNTIVEGFFKTIRSEISQQIAELSSKLDSRLAHLHSMGKRCVEKQTQMQNDYQRIASRYIKIFEDLNNELSNRIYELDKSAFVFKKQNDNQYNRVSKTDLVSTVSVFGAEGGDLQACISASITKKRAFDTIAKANTFLLKQKRLNRTINEHMLKKSGSAIWYSPVCFIETENEKSQINKNIYQANFVPQIETNQLIADFQAKNWSKLSQEKSNQIGRYLNAEVNTHYNGIDTHTKRVRENIVKMLNYSQIKNV